MAARQTGRAAGCLLPGRECLVRLIAGVLCLWLVGCGAAPIPPRIALLAPFEGRYREIGYDALYAARMALQDTPIELLPIDDGGSFESAADRVRALAYDPQVMLILALGYAAAGPEALSASGKLPVLVIGNWGIPARPEQVFILSSPVIDDRLTIPARSDILDAAQFETPFIGGDVLSLTQFARLRSSLEGITVMTSASLPDPAFQERYQSSDPFASSPGLLASLTYDAAGMAAQAVQISSGQREGVLQALSTIHYNGLNGTIAFENGYWTNAPVNTYTYDQTGTLIPIDHIVE